MAANIRQNFLSDLARALGLSTPDSSGDNGDLILAESRNAGIRIEARFSDNWLFISFTDLLKLPGFSELRRALSLAYCVNPSRRFIPSIEPVSRRLRFQRSIALGDGAPPSPSVCAEELLAAITTWRGAER
ncbi:MAG: hypothetical protein MPK06_04635 [Alphaproteobacteria bacterium]|nr:hypothetical protein [Alphaproteobacteria bacterium]MDA8004470.1 hypothetical protein [Alphaproteobacteria bacterium]MDA8005807.1 hypothetical protein [Alphaproteobacteria bacterium]MDA8013533.1 hypothetical protein [Alphaproteobacteria bacterium]